MSFERGSFTAIVGPSGCGKTTLLSLLGGLDKGDAGKVVVDGLDLNRASNRELTEYRRKAIGFVFQFYNLLPSLTALENVEAGLEFLNLKAPARRERALAYLAKVGMAELAHRFPAQLSGGQQQRVAVARVLAREPKLLLADEPTGNLDEESGERIFECMRDLQRQSGVTCIMVTHDVELAGRVDNVIRMRDGRVIDDAAPGLGRHASPRSLPARRRRIRRPSPMTLFRFAWRELLRAKGRFALIALILTLQAAALGGGYVAQESLYFTRDAWASRLHLADVEVQFTPASETEMPSLDAVRAVPGVAAVNRRFVSSGYIETSGQRRSPSSSNTSTPTHTRRSTTSS